MVAPVSPGIPSGGRIPPDINTQLEALARQWEKQDPIAAASIRQYIQSGWKSAVSPQVQQAVSAIVGRPVPAYGVPADGSGQPLFNVPPGNAAAPPGYGAGPQIGGLTQGASTLAASLPSIFGYNPPAAQGGPQAFPDQPPLPTPDPGTLPVFPGKDTGQGGARPFDTSASVGTPFPGKDTGQGGGGFFSGPPAQGAINFSGVVDEFGRPAGQNYANTVATDQAAVASQRAAAAQAGAQRGGRAVSGFVPDPNNPLAVTPGSKTTTPSGAFGAIDPTSAIGQQGYTQAQAGDPTALSAVLTSLLGKFGIDVNRGGIFTPGLVSSLAPYLKTVMEYGGLANGGKPVIPSQLADQFGGMIGGANTFGQIQDFAKGLLPTLGGMLSAPAGALADSGNQAGIVNDLLGMLTAGASPLYQQYQQGVNKKTLSDYVQSQLGGPTQNYIDWMRQNAAKTPGSDLLAAIIGGGR